MLSFIQFLAEGKHEYIDNHKLNSNSPEHYIHAALTHTHPGVVAYGVRHYNPTAHPNLAQTFDDTTKHKDWWVRAEAARNPHLTSEQKDRLAADKNSKVSGAFTGTSKPTSEKPAKPTSEKPTKTQKPAKPTKSDKLSIVAGDPAEHPYADAVSHIMKNNKPVGSVISGTIPSEYGQDRKFHTAYTGDYVKTGLTQHSTHPSHNHALLALVNHLKK